MKKYTLIEKQNFMLIALAVILIILLGFDIFKDKSGFKTSAGGSARVIASPTGLAKTSIDNDPYLGDKNKAKVAIVEFSDYECPFCKRFYDESFKQIKEKYVDTQKVIFVYRDLPIHDAPSIKDATAAECVAKIGGNEKYFEMAGLIFGNVQPGGQGLPNDTLFKLTGQIGIDKNQFESCLNNNNFKDEINKDAQDAAAAGINGTPGFVIGKLDRNGQVSGEVVSGAQPYNSFEAAIERQLTGR